MLRVIAIKKPNPIVEFVITAHAPGKRFVWVTSKMAVVTVEIGKAMPKIPERKKETDIAPVKEAENDKRGNEQR